MSKCSICKRKSTHKIIEEYFVDDDDFLINIPKEAHLCERHFNKVMNGPKDSFRITIMDIVKISEKLGLLAKIGWMALIVSLWAATIFGYAEMGTMGIVMVITTWVGLRICYEGGGAIRTFLKKEPKDQT